MNKYNKWVEGNFICNSMAIDNDVAWAISTYEGIVGLYQFSLTDQTAKLLGELPSEYANFGGYSLLEIIGQKLIIAPFLGKGDFIKYDLEKQIFTYPDYRNNDVLTRKEMTAFTNVINANNRLFFFQDGTGDIIEYSEEEDSFIINKTELKEIADQNNKKLVIPWYSVGYYDDSFFVPVYSDNKIVEIDINSFKSKIHFLPDDFIIEHSVCKNDKILLYSENNLKAAIFDLVLKKTLIYENNGETIYISDLFDGLKKNVRKPCLIGNKGNELIWFEEEREQVVRGRLNDGMVLYRISNQNECDRVFLLEISDRKIYCIDSDMEKVYVINMMRNYVELATAFSKIIDCRNIVFDEKWGMNLSQYINICVKKQ